MFWLITLPFRIFFALLFAILLLPFALLWLPLLLLRVAFKTIFAIVFLPIVLVVLLVGLVLGAIALSFAIVLPLVPFALAAAFIWMIVRLASRPKNLTIG